MRNTQRLEMMVGPMFLEGDGGAGGGGDDAAAKAAAKAAQEKADQEEKDRIAGLTLDQLQKENATLRYENAERRVDSDKAAKVAADAVAAQKEADEKAAAEKGEFKTLYENLKADQEGSAGKVTAMEATIEKFLEVEIAAIPESQRVILDQFSTVQAKLDFIATAKATKLFDTPGGPGVRVPGEPTTDTLEAQHAEAMKSGNLALAMSIKSKMRQLQQ